MPLEPQKPVETPNALYCPQLLLQTAIVNGQLVTSCQITLAGATVDEAGKWTRTGQTGMEYLPNLFALDEDIAAIAPQVEQIYGMLVEVVDAVNKARKVL